MAIESPEATKRARLHYFAWSVLGASLGPVLVVRLFRWPLPTGVALTMMGAAIAAGRMSRPLPMEGRGAKFCRNP